MMKEVTRGRAAQVGNVVLLLLALFYLYEGRDLLLWRQAIPGPRFLPNLLGSVLALVALLLIINEARRPTATPFRMPTRMPIIVTAILIIYVYLLPIVGYGIANGLMMLACLRLYQPHSWIADLLGSAAVAIALYLLFGLLLPMQLPRGVIFGG